MEKVYQMTVMSCNLKDQQYKYSKCMLKVK